MTTDQLLVGLSLMLVLVGYYISTQLMYVQVRIQKDSDKNMERLIRFQTMFPVRGKLIVELQQMIESVREVLNKDIDNSHYDFSSAEEIEEMLFNLLRKMEIYSDVLPIQDAWITLEEHVIVIYENITSGEKLLGIYSLVLGELCHLSTLLEEVEFQE